MRKLRKRANRRAIVEVRTQHSTGSGTGKFGGPELYVAVQIVPEGVEPLKALQGPAAKRRGIEIVYCGEGYGRSRGPRSAFGRAMAAAEKLADEINRSGAAT